MGGNGRKRLSSGWGYCWTDTRIATACIQTTSSTLVHFCPLPGNFPRRLCWPRICFRTESVSRHALGANDRFRPAYISSIGFGLTALYHEDLCSMSLLYSEHMTAGRFAWFGWMIVPVSASTVVPSFRRASREGRVRCFCLWKVPTRVSGETSQ